LQVLDQRRRLKEILFITQAGEELRERVSMVLDIPFRRGRYYSIRAIVGKPLGTFTPR
jgi:hypothetical protein